MDEDILRTVEKISGKLSRDCYYDLCCLVKAAIPRMPGTFSMETLYPEAQRYSEKEKDTLAKALSRAAEDIWDAETGRSCRSSFNACCGKSPRRRIWSGCWPCRSGAGARRSDIWWSCCREGNRQR